MPPPLLTQDGIIEEAKNMVRRNASRADVAQKVTEADERCAGLYLPVFEGIARLVRETHIEQLPELLAALAATRAAVCGVEGGCLALQQEMQARVALAQSMADPSAELRSAMDEAEPLVQSTPSMLEDSDPSSSSSSEQLSGLSDSLPTLPETSAPAVPKPDWCRSLSVQGVVVARDDNATPQPEHEVEAEKQEQEQEAQAQPAPSPAASAAVVSATTVSVSAEEKQTGLAAEPVQPVQPPVQPAVSRSTAALEVTNLKIEVARLRQELANRDR